MLILKWRSFLGAIVLFAAFGLAGCAAQPKAGKTLEVVVSASIQASPSAVWDVIGDFGTLDKWHPAVVSSDRNGDLRKLTLGDGGVITERLVAYGEGTYTYLIVESPLPVKNYVSTLKVVGDDLGPTTVIWSSTFEAAGVTDDEAMSIIKGVYVAGLDSLKKNFE